MGFLAINTRPREDKVACYTVRDYENGRVIGWLYQQYVILERRNPSYIYDCRRRYGMMKSALLFYRKLVSELQVMGFEINPYNPCVANKTIYGTQMTTLEPKQNHEGCVRDKRHLRGEPHGDCRNCT